MIELVGGILGGLGLFFVGMRLLTENLKTLASRRLRMVANRWTENRLGAFAWGTAAGAVTQSVPALTFIVVSILRSGLISTRGGFAIILGGCLGGTLLVLVVTLDIELVSLYLLGVTSVLIVSGRANRFRALAEAVFGGAMIILGLVLVKESAMPLADQPWFGAMMEWTGVSLPLAFAVSALLTALVQSSTTVCVFGISMAALGVITTEQTMMLIYGSCFGSALLLALLSANLAGRSRQVAMYMVFYNVLASAVMVLLLYAELYFDIPLMKALALSIDLDRDQQLAFVFIFLDLFCAPVMLLVLGPSTRIFDRLWPATEAEDLSKAQFIHDHASENVESSLALIDLEQQRVVGVFPRYLDAKGSGTELSALREAAAQLMSEIDEFLHDLIESHPGREVEGWNSMLTRQKLLYWVEEALATLCDTLAEPGAGPVQERWRENIREGVGAVLLALHHAVEAGDGDSWTMAKQLAGDRSALMHRTRSEYNDLSGSSVGVDLSGVIRTTNAVEQLFLMLSKLVQEIDGSPAFRPGPMPAPRDAPLSLRA